jgi:hypothetical protein
MCEAHDIPLVSGHYLISVWLADWYTDHDSKIDVLRIIVGNDQSELLRPPTSVNGHLDWPAIWHVDACCLGQTVQPSRVPVEAIPDTSGGRRAVSR